MNETEKSTYGECYLVIAHLSKQEDFRLRKKTMLKMNTFLKEMNVRFYLQRNKETKVE